MQLDIDLDGVELFHTKIVTERTARYMPKMTMSYYGVDYEGEDEMDMPELKPGILVRNKNGLYFVIRTNVCGDNVEGYAIGGSQSKLFLIFPGDIFEVYEWCATTGHSNTPMGETKELTYRLIWKSKYRKILQPEIDKMCEKAYGSWTEAHEAGLIKQGLIRALELLEQSD